jgi:hypothetical protein
MKQATVDVENGSYKNLYILASSTIAGSATAPEYFTADVYYEGESIPELVKVGIKKDNVGSSDAELASITSIFNKITGNSHTKIWSYNSSMGYASAFGWYSYEIPCDINKKVDKVTFKVSASNRMITIISMLGEKPSVKDMFALIASTDVNVENYEAQVDAYNKVKTAIEKAELKLEEADEEAYATFTALENNIKAYEVNKEAAETASKINKATYTDIPLGSGANSKVFIPQGTTLSDIENPKSDLYTKDGYDYVFDFLQTIWYNKNMGIDETDGDAYTWAHKPLYYKNATNFTQTYISLDEKNNWTLPYLEEDGETVKYLTYNIKPTEKVIQLAGPVGGTYQKLTEKAKELYGEKFASMKTATVNIPEDNYKNIYILASGGVAQNVSIAPENFYAEIYYKGEENPVKAELGILKRDISESDPELGSQTAIMNKITGKSNTKFWQYTSEKGYACECAWYSYEIPCDMTKKVEKISFTNKTTGRIVTILSMLGEKPSFADVMDAFATTDMNIDNYYAQKAMLEIADSVIERDGLNLSAATGSYAEKYALLKSNIAEFEEYKKALDPQVTLDIVCYSGKGAEVYVNLLNPSEIADKEYNIILAYYDEADNVIKTNIKPFKTTTAYKESFTFEDEAVEGAAKVKCMAWKNLMTLKPLGKVAEVDVTEAQTFMFVGDSITHADLYPFHAETYFITRFPMQKAEFINVAKSGGTALNAINRYDMFIKGKNATKSVIMFGMNDVQRGYYAIDNQGSDEHKAWAISQCLINMEALAGMIEQEGSEVILMTPSIADERGGNWTTTKNTAGLNDAIGKIADGFFKLAEDKGYGVIDTYSLTRTIHDKYMDSGVQEMISTDRVHPIQSGYYVLGYNVIRNLFKDSGLVAQVDIDANTKTAKTENATVKGLDVADGKILYTYLPKALPMPVTSAYHTADAKYVPLTDELNREIIKVSGLDDGTYTVKMDGKLLGEYTNAQLEEGVNIAILDNNAGQLQAKVVYDILDKKHQNTLNMRHLDYVKDEFRKYKLFDDLDKRAEYIAKLSGTTYVYDFYVNYDSYCQQLPIWQAENKEYLENARKAAIPAEHTVEIIKK